MKTIELRNFYKELSELNNGLTHYTFVWNQFNIDYFEILKSLPDTYTSNYFLTNPYKRKHNIKLIDLENEHIKTNKTLIEGIFLLTYSYFESYLKNVFEFSQNIDETIKCIETKLDGVEDDLILFDKIVNRIEIDRNDFDLNILNTLDYLRLKRNRLTHTNSQHISKSLNKLIKSYGKSLNTFWDEKLPKSRQGINFASKENVALLNSHIIIDSINIFRHISAIFDQILVTRLTIKKIVIKHIIPEFIEDQYKNIKHFKVERQISKFSNFCKTKYGINVNYEVIDLFTRSIA